MFCFTKNVMYCVLYQQFCKHKLLSMLAVFKQQKCTPLNKKFNRIYVFPVFCSSASIPRGPFKVS